MATNPQTTQTSPEPVYIVYEPGEGIYGVAATPAAAQVIAGENVSIYFGKPIEWKVRGEGSDHEEWEGSYSRGPYQTGRVYLSRYPVHTRTSTDI